MHLPHVHDNVCIRSLGGELELDLRDSSGGVQSLRACAGAIEDSVATVQTHLVLQPLLALSTIRVLSKVL